MASKRPQTSLIRKIIAQKRGKTPSPNFLSAFYINRSFKYFFFLKIEGGNHLFFSRSKLEAEISASKSSEFEKSHKINFLALVILNLSLKYRFDRFINKKVMGLGKWATWPRGRNFRGR